MNENELEIGGAVPESEPIIDREELVAFAKEHPGDPEVRDRLLKWLEQTGVQDGSGASAIEYIDVTIMQTVMKFRMGFLDENEALAELDEAGMALGSENGEEASKMSERLINLMHSISNGTFEADYPTAWNVNL